MYQVSVYAITSELWRWEIRRDGALVYCGTAPSKSTAEASVKCVIKR